jgi:hypothetical protein
VVECLPSKRETLSSNPKQSVLKSEPWTFLSHILGTCIYSTSEGRKQLKNSAGLIIPSYDQVRRNFEVDLHDLNCK